MAEQVRDVISTELFWYRDITYKNRKQSRDVPDEDIKYGDVMTGNQSHTGGRLNKGRTNTGKCNTVRDVSVWSEDVITSHLPQ
jgi:hypothetical protein